MAHMNWKLVASLAVAVVLIVLAVQRFTRAIRPNSPPAAGDAIGRGSVDPGTAARMQSVLDAAVNDLKVPGLQAAVVTPEGGTWSGVSGTTDLRRRTVLRRDHILRVGSTTKTFTAVVIMRLAEDGRISLEDPISKWFPDYPNAHAITIQQLLNHSSGIPDVLETEVLMKSIVPWTRWEPHHLVDIISRHAAHFAPGSGWWYSNTNYILLGLIAEQITGRTAAELLREQVLDPLGLHNTYFVPYEPAPAMLMPGYDRDLSRFPGMLDIEADNTSWATAAYTSGAMASTADDLAAFYSRLFAGEVVSPASLQQMTMFVEAPNPGFAAQDGYGLGLMRLHVDGQELIGHVGEFMGSTAIAMYAPDQHYLVVVTCNLSYPDLVQVVTDLSRAMK